jgi:hypothetical protein
METRKPHAKIQKSKNPNKHLSDAETEEALKYNLLIGVILTLHCWRELSEQLPDGDLRSNSDIRVMGGRLSSELWVMANHLMSTFDRLKTLSYTSVGLLKITGSGVAMHEAHVGFDVENFEK